MHTHETDVGIIMSNVETTGAVVGSNECYKMVDLCGDMVNFEGKCLKCPAGTSKITKEGTSICEADQCTENMLYTTTTDCSDGFREISLNPLPFINCDNKQNMLKKKVSCLPLTDSSSCTKTILQTAEKIETHPELFTPNKTVQFTEKGLSFSTINTHSFVDLPIQIVSGEAEISFDIELKEGEFFFEIDYKLQKLPKLEGGNKRLTFPLKKEKNILRFIVKTDTFEVFQAALIYNITVKGLSFGSSSECLDCE